MPASITLTVAHLPSATSFFLTCLQPLNYVYRGRIENTIGFGLPDAAPDFWITQSIPGVPPGPAHVAFPAVSREVVRQFFIAAMKTGARCQGEPALRDIKSGYYSAAVIDFDNNSIEAVYREDVAGFKDDGASTARSNANTKQSTVAKSKASTTVSSATKAKSTAPTEVRSIAPSTGPTTVSRASTKASLPRSTASKSTSEATPQPNTASVGLGGFLDEAKGTLNVAKELVSSVSGNKNKTSSDPDSHGPSDAIVGTLLGVAAGAALHYAFSNRKKTDEETSSQDVPQPGIARSETAPSYSQERYRFYHGYTAPQTQLAIDDQRSAYSRASGQRMIEMVDNDPTRSEYAPSTARQHRRNSLTGPLPSQISSIRSKKQTTTAIAPPTSYRALATTSPKSTRSRASSLSRESQRTIRLEASPKQDEGYASASDTRSRSSRRSSAQYDKAPSGQEISTSHRRRRGSESHSQKSSVITAIKNFTEPIPPRTKDHHHHHSHHQSRRETASEADKQSFHSARTSKRSAIKSSSKHGNQNALVSTASNPDGVVASGGKGSTLTRKQLEKLEDNGRPRSDITRSVIGKVKDMDRLDLSSREVRPEDSVSQVSSNNSSARRRRG